MKPLFSVFFTFAFAFFAGQPARLFGANVAVMVVETNIAGQLKDERAGIWENGIMDVLFGEGYIVSNARSMRVAQNDREDFPPEALGVFQDAIENGSDYFVLTTLNYQPAEDKKAPPVLLDVSVKLFKISPYRFVVEKKWESGGAGKSANYDEPGKAQEAAKALLPYLGGRI